MKVQEELMVGLLDTLVSLGYGVLLLPPPYPVDMEQNQKVDLEGRHVLSSMQAFALIGKIKLLY